jgi:hypothetical protein
MLQHQIPGVQSIGRDGIGIDPEQAKIINQAWPSLVPSDDQQGTSHQRFPMARQGFRTGSRDFQRWVDAVCPEA